MGSLPNTYACDNITDMSRKKYKLLKIIECVLSSFTMRASSISAESSEGDTVTHPSCTIKKQHLKCAE